MLLDLVEPVVEPVVDYSKVLQQVFLFEFLVCFFCVGKGNGKEKIIVNQ